MLQKRDLHGLAERLLSVGVVAGSSVLGMLIPPSLLLIVFGILAETSIGDLFIAGILPGIVLSLAYCLLIWIMARRFPDKVGTEEALNTVRPPQITGLQAASKSAPIELLIVAVLGGIYGGLFTATEAGGIVTIIAVEIGLLTPPLGLACFVIHNNLADGRIGIDDVFWGAAPFALTMLAVLLLVVAFPELATALV